MDVIHCSGCTRYRIRSVVTMQRAPHAGGESTTVFAELTRCGPGNVGRRVGGMGISMVGNRTDRGNESSLP